MPRTYTLTLPDGLFNEVKSNLEIGLKAGRPFTDEEVSAFLMRHTDILGSIVHFDEVDTTDRERIWEAQRDEATDAISR